MKKITIIGTSIMLALTVLTTSCSDEFINWYSPTSIDEATAFKDADGCEGVVIGILKSFTSSAYTGRNLTVIGDLVTDNVTTLSGSSGHLQSLEIWNITPSTGEIANIWTVSYDIVASSTKMIGKAKELLAAPDIKDGEKKALQTCIAAALTMKAYAEYILVQYFALPYSQVANPSSANGIILVKDKSIGINDPVSPSSLEATYQQMLAELKEAIDLYTESKTIAFKSSSSQFYPTLAMAYTLQARVFLDMEKNEEAIQAADNALKNLPNGTKKELVGYTEIVNAYNQNTSSIFPEDIFCINYNSQDNLSANSINNMYGSYGANISENCKSLFQGKDIRKELWQKYAPNDSKNPVYSYCLKYPQKDNISNVAVFRVPELYLIKAEAYAKIGQDADAKTEILRIQSVRDTTMKTVENLDRAFSGISTLDLVLDERRREFVGEGHRWFDIRRNGKTLDRPGDVTSKKFRLHFMGYNIAAFAYPIPEGETNTGQWKNGTEGMPNGGQNEAWIQSGNTYVPKNPLPFEGMGK